MDRFTRLWIWIDETVQELIVFDTDITPIQTSEIYAGARKKELIQIEKLLNSLKNLI